MLNPNFFVKKLRNLWHVFLNMYYIFGKMMQINFNRFLTGTWLIRTKQWHRAPTLYNVLSPAYIWKYQQ